MTFRSPHSPLQTHHPTAKFDRSMGIASVIVTFMVTCRVLPRFTLDSRSDLPPFVPSYEGRANVNFFLINRLCALDSLFCASKSDNPFTFILFRTLLHKRISQLFCNQFVPHSLSKTPGVGTPPALFLFVPDRYYCRRCCHRRCRPVVAPLRNNGKRHLSLFSSYRCPTSPITTRGGVPPPKVLSAPHFFARGNSVGSAGGWSAMASSSGKCTRSGSGTFTLERLRMLMSWRALTTALP